MRPVMTPDESLIRQLPLPLAQLYRRAHNAKTALDRQLTAFYLWEASLKLLASVAIVEYAERGPADPRLVEPLHNLARPSLGHWWEFVRLLVPALADRGDEPFQKTRTLLTGRPRDDCPRAAGLDALLREVMEGKSGARATVQFGELFGRLLTFRNAELGHGAAGQRSEDFYERLGSALLAGLAEVLTQLDVLAGRRLLFVADVRRLATGNWLVERYDLHGEAPRRLESQEVPDAAAAALPRPGRLYLHAAGAEAAGRSLHPLLVHDAETGWTYFLNSRHGQRRADYLCYTNGKVVRREELGGEQRELLARVLGGPVDPTKVESWAAHSQAEEEPPNEPAPPRRTIGEFELISRLGRGGMGVVYRAWQPSLGRQVALKCLLRTGDPKAEARFAREIHALGRVEHPNLVKVFTSGAEGEQWFYAMELMEGADLAAVCARLASSTAAELGEDDWTAAVSTACEQQRNLEQPLSADGPRDTVTQTRTTVSPTTAEPHAGRGHIAQVVELLRQAAEAAHALHEAGVVHRDVKPGNIMVSHDGKHAVLMDLGLAQLQDETRGRLTQTRQFVGTLRYASPEQLGGATLDRRADIYSLGATLWELLTFCPFLGITDQLPTPDTIFRVQQAEPERVRKYNGRVPADLEAIVLKCLEKDPARRYATAAELAADLGRWQRGEAVVAQPACLSYLLGKQVRRHRRLLTVAAVALLAVVIGFLLAFLRVTVALRDETEARREADRLRVVAEKAQADWKAQFPLVARGYSGTSAGEFARGNAADSLNWMLRAYEVAPGDDPRRPSYLNLLLAQGQSLGRPLCGPLRHDGDVQMVAFSPDGRAALSASADKTARLWDAATGRPLLTLTHDDTVWAVAVSPDGRTALTGSTDKTARLWDAATGQLLLTLTHESPVRAVAFSPDSRTALTACGDGTARLWDAATGKARATLNHDGIVWAAAFSPDGRRVITASEDKTARLWDVATGTQTALLQHGDVVWAAAFSPDGRAALTASQDKTARLWDVASGQMRAELRHEEWVNAVGFSPDGRTLLTGSNDMTARLWDAATGKALHVLRHDGLVWGAQFSPDGSTVLTGGGDMIARLWDAQTGKPLARFPHGSGVWSLAFSPDGRSAVTSDHENSVWLWDATTGRLRNVVAGEATVFAAAFSPDGNSLLTGASDGTARLSDNAGGQPLAAFRHEDRVLAVAFCPTDAPTVLTGSRDKTARLWDVSTGKELAKLNHDGAVVGVAFSPDGRTLLTGSYDKTARLWDAASGRQLKKLAHDAEVRGVAFSPDGRTVLTACNDGTARLWDTATGQPLTSNGTARPSDEAIGKPLPKLLRHASPVAAAAFSPDGSTILTGSHDNTARLWETATGKPLAIFRHAGPVYAVRFSRDGRTVLTASADKTARLWDLQTGQMLGELTHTAPVLAAAFHPDGHTVLSFSDGGASWRWSALPEAPDDPARLGAWVRVRTRKVFDGDTLRPLSAEEYASAWDDLAARGGDWETTPDARAWHLVRASLAEIKGEWLAAAFHLGSLPESDRNTAEVRQRRGWAHAELRKWDAAVADYQEACRLAPNNVNAWYQLGLAHLGRDDIRAYRDHCRRMLGRFGKTEDAATAKTVVWLAALVPGAVNDPGPLVQLAMKAQVSQPSNPVFNQTLGAALYRAGRPEAVSFLNAAVTFQQEGGTPGTQLFLALATERLGQQLALPSLAGMLAAGHDYRPQAALPLAVSDTATSGEWLSRAERQVNDSPSPSWLIEVQRRYLLQEATALLKPAGK